MSIIFYYKIWKEKTSILLVRNISDEANYKYIDSRYLFNPRLNIHLSIYRYDLKPQV